MTAIKQLRNHAAKRGDQLRIAKRLGVEESTVSRLLSGKIKPSLQLAFKIQDALGIPAKDWAS